MLNVILFIVYLILTVSGLVLFKLGSNSGFTASFLNGTCMLKFNYLMIVGLCCYVISFMLYMIIVSKFNLTYIFPLTQGIICVGVFLASVFILKEPFSAMNIIGIALVLAGVIFLNIKK